MSKTYAVLALKCSAVRALQMDCKFQPSDSNAVSTQGAQELEKAPSVQSQPSCMREIYEASEQSRQILGPWSSSAETLRFIDISQVDSLEQSVDEVIDTATKIYQSLLDKVDAKQPPMTIIAPGQSPSYIALAMLNLPIYDPDKVNMVVLPMSGLKPNEPDPRQNSAWFELYLAMMAKRELTNIRPHMVEDATKFIIILIIKIKMRTP